MTRLLLAGVFMMLLSSCGEQQPPTATSAVVAPMPTAVVADEFTLPKNPPSKADAEQWYQDFRAAKDKVFDGIFITKTDQHMQFNGEVIELTRRAEALFGAPMTSKLANCTIAAISLQDAWITSAEIMRTGDLEKYKPNHIALMAWSGAEKYPDCLSTMELLK